MESRRFTRRDLSDLVVPREFCPSEIRNRMRATGRFSAGFGARSHQVPTGRLNYLQMIGRAFADSLQLLRCGRVKEERSY